MQEPAVVVGVVTKAHGVRGEVSVHSRSDNPDRWVPGGVVFTRSGRSLTIRAARPHGNRLLVTFEGVSDRAQAEGIRGEVVVPEAWLPPPGEGEWWPHELEGCLVVTDSGRELGRVAEVVFNPANDIWVTVDDAGQETLVPALKDLLLDVDVAAKRVVVRDVPGLTAPDEE